MSQHPQSILIKNATIVNEGALREADILIQEGRISKISGDISDRSAQVIEASGLHVFPGVIDDQVHFREPGLTHKGDIYTESRAAVAGGVTSFMEMPNTVPNTLTQTLLEEKYSIAEKRSLANYSFFMGASNDNLEEILKTDPENVCGLKIFMGSSTGNMLVDNDKALNTIFSSTPMLIATHCEDERTIRQNIEIWKNKYGDNIPFEEHPNIRSEEACFLSSSYAVDLAKKYNTRLHILHISTAKEIELFDNKTPLREKRITAEVCIHHLWFDQRDYNRLGSRIKWNPAVKSPSDKEALFKAMLDDHLDIIATDHAPHTLDEKEQSYLSAPSGGPLIQHSLPAMIEFYHRGKISLEKIAEKMSHAVADCFRIKDRGYIREGYRADLSLVNLNAPWRVEKENILAKCKWSPFEGLIFRAKVTDTFVNGYRVWSNGRIIESPAAMRLKFERS
ncbi:MAG TPA: dihydroorotase [Bacteroidia bacterium]|nr:dihydroorotase [Bacteroidia bacterium]